MEYSIIHTCPVCSHSLHVKKLACSHCHTVIENNFSLSRFANLSEEQIHFIEIFIIKRGNIKEVEKTLHISYPTVRSRLNGIIKQLGYGEESNQESLENDNKPLSKSEIIAMLENDEIQAKEAIALLKKSSKE